MAVITGPGQQQPLSGAGISGTKRPHGYQIGQMQNFTPEQMQMFSQLFGFLGPDSFLGKLAAGDQSAFAEMEAPALRQFNEVLGGIGSKFSGMGSGARRSSGFQNATTAAGSNFAQELQANRLGLQRQATGDLMNYANQLLGQRPYEQYLIEKDRKKSGNYGGAASGALSGATSGSAFGPWGAAAGGLLGAAGGYFS